MTDVEFLQWMHDRVIGVYGEHKDMDFMHKFRSIIEAQKASSNTAYMQLPSLEAITNEFLFDRNKPIAKELQISTINNVYAVIKRLGNCT